MAIIRPAELCEVLRDEGVYPYSPERIEIKQTHISVVALAPPYVYKFKKPVDFGFLDFTDLEKRRKACEAEVKLNRRLCSGVYEGVVTLHRRAEGDGYQLEDGGDVVDVAVKMRMLSPDGFLHRDAEDGTLSADAIDRVADRLVDFYDERPSDPAIAEAGWIDNLRVNTDENFRQTEEHVGSMLTRPAYEALRDFTNRFYDAHAALLNRRRAGGHVINGHGDLRLEHVHVTGDAVCIYDCIEFNDRFRHLDVANDVAFLAMDLDHHGYTQLARRLVQRIADGLGDEELAEVVDFYKVYRAYVRGKVEGMTAADDEVPAAERSQSRARARRHYQWAMRYAVAGSEPLVVVVMGRTGTGKSTQASAVAEALGWPRVSSDRVRKTRAGVPLHVRPEPAVRERLYAPETSDAVYRTLAERAVESARRGIGTVLDATYSSADRRNALRDRLQEANVPYAFIELEADTGVRRERLGERTSTPTVSDARPEDLSFLDDRYQPPSSLWDARHLRVQTSDTIHDTTRDVLRALVRLRDG